MKRTPPTFTPKVNTLERAYPRRFAALVAGFVLELAAEGITGPLATASARTRATQVLRLEVLGGAKREAA